MWESHSTLTKLTFTQDEKMKEFMLSNNHEKFKIPFYEFEEFETGKETKVEIMHASSLREGFEDRSSNFSLPLIIVFKAL